LNLTIQDGKFTVLVGASGCGKTTLLRMIAGIGPASSGRVLMDGRGYYGPCARQARYRDGLSKLRDLSDDDRAGGTSNLD
jgi:ABC-type Fe3+/spermidine/putrescine transport system ATPase subunit